MTHGIFTYFYFDSFICGWYRKKSTCHSLQLLLAPEPAGAFKCSLCSVNVWPAPSRFSSQRSPSCKSPFPFLGEPASDAQASVSRRVNVEQP